MLERINTEKIVSTLKSQGYSDIEFYAELEDTTHIVSEQRLHKTYFEVIEGIGVQCRKGSATHYFYSNQIDTSSLLAVIDSNEPMISKVGNSLKSNFDYNKIDNRLKNLDIFVRTSWPDSREKYSCQYKEKNKFFEGLNFDGNFFKGVEKSSAFSISWKNEKGIKSYSYHDVSQKELIETLLSDNPVKKYLKKNKTLWPPPKGEIAVVFSEKAFSNLLILLLRGFEGDLFAANLSFLSKIDSFALPFNLVDAPVKELMPTDHEGSDKKELVILERGRPQGIACNKLIAQELSIKPTGHGRRESFKNKPIIGFWRVFVNGLSVEEDPIYKLDKGILISELEVLSFDPISTDIEILLTDSTLIHEGEIGENIEQLSIKTNLLKIMSNISKFNSKNLSITLKTRKLSQSFLTEFICPYVISSMNLPGKVPQNYYW